MSELKVEGLGKNNVPNVEGMNNGKIDVTSVPTPTPAPEVQKIDVTSQPTVTPAPEVQKLDVTSTPTVSTQAAQSFNVTDTPTVQSAPTNKIDVTAAPTVGGNQQQKIDFNQMPTPGGNSSNTSSGPNYGLIIGIGIGAFVFIAIIILLVTSLGGKKLVCTYSEDESTYKENFKFTIKFDGDNKAKSVSVEDVTDFSKSDLTDTQIEEQMKEYVSTYEKKYDNLKYKRDGKVITVTYNIKSEDLKSDRSYDDYKKELEKTGYTCK